MVLKRRDPREFINASLGLGIGFGVIVVPVVVGLATSAARPFAILGAASIQTAVLMADSNRFGTEGPGFIGDLLVGDVRQILAGERRAVVRVPALVVALAPVVVALVIGRFDLLIATWILGAGAVMSSSGIALLVSAVGAYGVPGGNNPFAVVGGGAGCLGALLFAASSLLVLVLAAPMALAAYLTDDWLVLTAVAAATAAGNIGVGELAMRAARRRIASNLPELSVAVQRL